MNDVTVEKGVVIFGSTRVLQSVSLTAECAGQYGHGRRQAGDVRHRLPEARQQPRRILSDGTGRQDVRTRGPWSSRPRQSHGDSDRTPGNACLLYTSDAADEEDSVDLGG